MTETTLEQPTWLDEEDAPVDQLPRRPRRKLVTRGTAGLAAVIIGAAGFIGGVEMQKGSATASTGAGAGAGTGARPAGFAGGPPGAAGGQSTGASGSVTTGQVKSKDGSTLYVTDANGNTVKVTTTSNSKISRDASAGASAIHPGDTVVIQGTTAASGTVKATNVSATASGVTRAGGGFPGGRSAGSATTPGTSSSNGGTP
jgi:hypothetical protein